MAKRKNKTIPRRKDEAYFHQKQMDRFGIDNIVEGTLLFVDPNNPVSEVNGHEVPQEVYDNHPNRQVVLIRTVDKNGIWDDNTRWVSTSDLHHAIHTEEVAKEVRLAKIRARRAEKRKLKAAEK
jgi:hypothetical protein